MQYDSKDRWTEIAELAARAAEAESAAAREAMLAGLPREVREEIESLLKHLEGGEGPLDWSPAAGVLQTPLAGRHIGPYEVLSELGQGGMGVVLLARRTDVGFEQKVALKLARLSFQSDFFIRRFLDEQRILARLDHPNIARILDGGLAADGTPYLAMQYVEGLALDAWCASQKPPLEELLRLFLKICAAVQFAHENLVVHRDLKPANILVNALGEPVLLDFGTARLVEAGSGNAGGLTAAPLMTLRYASPEQVAGESGSTRSDVYALSVVLYELLTGGEWPYGEPGTTAAMSRAVLEAEPVPASGRRRNLPGDLDAILLKGLSKDPALRYGSAAQLGDDLGRLLAHQPVVARRLTFGYRAGRFLRRHWVPSLAGFTVALALAGAAAWSARQARIANEQRDIAERERVRAEEIAAFTERLLGASRAGEVTPLATRGSALTVVEIIDEAARRIGGGEFENKPRVEAGLRSTIGGTYMALGEFGKARAHVDRAIALTAEQYGPESPLMARPLTARGRLRMGAGDWKGAHEDFAVCLRILEAEKSPNLSFLHSLLGESALRLGDATSARRHFEAALEDMTRQFGLEHIAPATMINNIGVVAEEMGDQEGAASRYAQAAGILRRLPGPPPNLVFPLIGLQRVHYYRGEYAEAKRICEEAYRVGFANGGEKTRHSLKADSQLALVEAAMGDVVKAEARIRKTVRLLPEAYAAGHFETGAGLTALGRVLLVRGKAAEAEKALREALRVLVGTYPKGHWRTAEARAFLGRAALDQKRTEEGRTLLSEGIREMESVLPASHPRIAEVRALMR